MHNWLTNAIGRRLREQRLCRSLSQRQLALLAGVPVKRVLQIERGALDIDMCSLVSLAAVLDVPVESLVDDSGTDTWERVLLIGATIVAADLEAPERQVMRVEKIENAEEIIAAGRVDCVVVGAHCAERIPQLRHLASRYNPQCRIVRLLQPPYRHCDVSDGVRCCTPAELSMVVQQMLKDTVRGQIGLMRRQLAELRSRQQQLSDTRLALAQQCQRLSLWHRKMASGISVCR